VLLNKEANRTLTHSQLILLVQYLNCCEHYIMHGRTIPSKAPIISFSKKLYSHWSVLAGSRNGL